MSFEIVYTDNVPDKLDIEREVLATTGVEIIDAEAADEPVETVLESADGVISSHQTFDEDLIARMSECKVISRRGIGVDYIDLDAAAEHGIIVANVPDYCITEVSNHALALLLTLHRRVISQNEAVSDGQWRPDAEPIQRLDGQTLGLVAFGDIAQALAEKALSLEMDVVAFDPYLDDETIRDHGATPVAFEKLLERSDIVSLHAPLTDESRKMIGRNELQSMKETAYIINTARGGLIDQAAVVEAVDSDEIAGAGLDVLEEEPPAPSEPLLEQDRVVLTPHMAHYSIESRRELRRKAAENILSVVRGEVPDNAVNETDHPD